MSVFDIDSKESKSKDDSHGGSNTEGSVNCWIDSGLLYPRIGSVLWGLGPVLWPNNRVAFLHVKGSAMNGVYTRSIAWCLL